ncbi:mechanosensitive ion channel family protein [Nostoc sp.]|uniref:mechanosensitive ion channel family protein n=1 Tax=Nostoc sp. TaxID=1180 RepID=UPI002FFAAAB7
MSNLSSDQFTLLQGLVLILGLPLLVVGLGELIERCRRHKNPLASVLNATRNLLLPLLALWLVMRQFFQVAEDAIALRMIGSLFWIACIYTTLLLLNIVLGTGNKQRFGQIHLPNLVFQFLRALVVLGILAYMLAAVWKVDLTKVVGTLGIGSLVIALALQDTLSNLVSGFLLIVESPFRIGDWIQVEELEGEVIEINWRAVRIKTLDRDIIIIPNGNLGKKDICNYTLLDPLHAVRLKIPFSYEDHPDLVRKTLRAAALSVEGIQPQPLPQIRPLVYKNTYIEYEIRFFITHYGQVEKIEDEFWTRAYYAIRRNRLHVPFADKIEYKLNHLPIDSDNTPEGLNEIIRSLPLFARLDPTTIQYLTHHATVELFGIGEQIICAGALAQAFYVLLRGQVLLSVDEQVDQQEVAHLSKGDFLGETVFLPGEPSPVSATVTDTATVLRLPPAAIAYVTQHHAKFALEMSQYIDERKKLITIAEGSQHSLIVASPPYRVTGTIS